jgi:hypothetical protein
MRSEAAFSASMEHIVIRWVIGFDLEQFFRIFVEKISESNQPSGEARSLGLPSPPLSLRTNLHSLCGAFQSVNSAQLASRGAPEHRGEHCSHGMKGE